MVLRAASRRFAAGIMFVFVALALSASAFAESRDMLGVGDTVRVTVFQNPDLTTETRITDAGTISFPMIGEVPLAGLTPTAAEGRIAQMLEQGKFVLKPQVNLNVTKLRSRQVTVLGQVAKPGRYPLEDPSLSVIDAIAIAGGIVQTGDDKDAVIVGHDGNTRMVNISFDGAAKNAFAGNAERSAFVGTAKSGDLASNVQLDSGDTVYVQRAPVFYIYGEVQKAGAYRLEPVMTVMQAIAVGGGITPRGTERGLKIRRKETDGNIRTIDAKLTDRLVADDVVYVAESLF
jgi:polysaccharide export outer membrane protein